MGSSENNKCSSALVGTAPILNAIEEKHSVFALFLFSFSRHSNIDMKTQEAYELAVKGLIRPMGKSPPIITAIRCLQFALPEFQLGRTGAEWTGGGLV